MFTTFDLAKAITDDRLRTAEARRAIRKARVARRTDRKTHKARTRTREQTPS